MNNPYNNSQQQQQSGAPSSQQQSSAVRIRMTDDSSFRYLTSPTSASTHKSTSSALPGNSVSELNSQDPNIYQNQ
jgi:hypothetical protein